MNQHETVEDQLASLGKALQNRESLTDRAVAELRRSSDRAPHPPVANGASSFAPRANRIVVAVVCMVTIAAGISLTMLPTSVVAWADVATVIQSQQWIRGTATYGDGEQGTIWLSPTRQVWAYQLGEACYYFDSVERVKWEYSGPGSTMQVLPLGEGNPGHVLPIGAMAVEDASVEPWLFSTEKIVHQERREVEEAGRTWIEFDMVLWRGANNLATLRVDPETRLPVHLVFASADDTAETVTWEFDYPQSGPADVYALGVPEDTRVVDLRLPAEAQEVLDAMAAGRDRMGEFRMLVAPSPGFFGYAVWRKENQWRVDICYTQGRQWPTAEMPVTAEQDAWFADQLSRVCQVPLYRCDGRTVWSNANVLPEATPTWEVSTLVAPQNLMLGEGLGSLPQARHIKLASLLYPDLTPRSGWQFEFVANLDDDCELVLVKRSATLATSEPTTGHEWYYIDPQKGHCVVRVELFNTSRDAVADPESSQVRQSILMDEFEQSASGVWHCGTINDTTPILNQRGQSADESFTTNVRYFADFEVKLDDSLFQALP